MLLLALVPLLAPVLAAASDDQLHVLHRIHGPDVPERPFTLRATLDPSTSEITPAPQLQDTLAQFFSDAKGNNDVLYQVALQTAPTGTEYDLAGDRLDISAVKACHIPIAAADFLTVHLDRSGTPFHIDYYLGDVPASGVCPSTKQLRALNLDQATWLHPSNTTVRVTRARHPPLPELRVPPPLSPKGQIVPPEPEKTLIQKYWLYIVAALGLLLLTGSAPPEEGGGQSTGGR